MNVLAEPVATAARVVSLGEAVELNPRADRGQLSDDLEVSFVPMAAVEAATGRMDVSTVRRFNEVKKGYTIFREGDVLFAKITPCMENGKMAVARGLRNGVGCGSTEFHVLRPRPGVDPHYIYYFVSSGQFRARAAHHMTGAVGQKRARGASRKQCEIPLPDLEGQRRIVADIEKQFSRLDDAMADLRRVNANLKRYKATVLSAAFQGDSGWRWATYADVGEVATGFTPPTGDAENFGGDVPFFKPTDLDAGHNVVIARTYLSKKGLARGRRLPGGSVLVTCIGATIGKTGLARVACATNQQINAVSPYRNIADSDFVYWWTVSPAGQQQIIRHASATTLPILNKSKFSALPVPLPALSEQRRIVSEIERQISVARIAEAEVVRSVERAEALKRAVLACAFHGEVVA